jgi:hypothetical protein
VPSAPLRIETTRARPRLTRVVFGSIGCGQKVWLTIFVMRPGSAASILLA